MKILAPYEALHREVLGKEPEDVGRWITPGLRLEDKDRKRIVVVDPSYSVVAIEEPPNVGYCRDTILALFEDVQRLLTVPRIARWGLRFTWIHAYGDNFEALLGACKERLLAPGPLIGRASDVGLVLDYVVNGLKLTVTAGPMKIEQLKSHFLAFEPKELPPVFLYLDVDTADVETPQYSRRHLGQLFDRGHGQAEAIAEEVISVVGV
ncbi:MAG: hypothetical protein Q8P22_05535 [Chloroflexota bacterium]|nr:hypothetical protein [Chloroflexota bacterium]